ncbi:ABC transporter ATP-binding protein [Nonomuraea sp. KC401]|uniref:ABC transporter ATP-binding protein n=1 Tax=unclassified Nonomuraea TaxID=2593643 RepID=UPI0010FE9A19|nr:MULTISPECIES: ABC transporter ATP-binding protein [unclassified Nonomuraea]NBE96650.1 ATP-binding cassette domain-containing protein [Nonomuraea sp. K271]TLF73850.1 ABC transporter ATP-binding protein [Nonomuraea sp. KC401]
MCGLPGREDVSAVPRPGPQWRVVRLVPLAGPALLSAMVPVNLALGALPVVFVVAAAHLLAEVPAAVAAGAGSPAVDRLLTAFAVAAAAFLLREILSPLQESLGELAARRVDGLMYDRLMATALRPRGLAALEDQRVLEALRLASRELEYGVQSPGQACAGALALLARVTELCCCLVAIGAAFSWWAALGLAAVVLLFRHGQRGGLRRYARARVALADEERRIDYLRRLVIEPGAGKEIRVFGLIRWLSGMLEDAYHGWLRPLWAARRRAYVWPFVWFTAAGTAVTVAVFWAVGTTAADRLALTGFLIVMQAALGALRLGEHYSEVDLQTEVGMRAHEAAERFAARIDAYPGGRESETADGPPAGEVPDPVHAIRFDQVRFGYPGGRGRVLDGLDLTIPAGRCTAIVGMNGAGKSTLVKLLCRLYDPDGGTIRVDGIDIASFPVTAWRRKLSVVFQDFARYEVSAAENIGFGAVGALDDRAGIEAAARTAGVPAVLGAAPGGLDVPLARHLSGGADLSGGQWQRIALARTLFALRHGSPVIVLDEPTASLDVRAETRFFDEFAELTQGATTLLISHRFATVRRADLIVVLAGGRCVEQGGHDELMARDGRYAHMFRLQAHRFAGYTGDPT